TSTGTGGLVRIDSPTLTGTVTATAFSGPLTGNVTGNASGSSGSCTGNAATATALQNARTIGGVSFDGTANITVATATGGFTVSGGNLALGTNSLTLTGSIASTGSRVTKGWFTDLESTNAIVASITGSAPTLTTSRNLWGQAFNGGTDVTGSLTSVADITGGASSMTITAGTGASRTLTFKTTTGGSTATTALTLAADQSATFANTVNATTFVGALTGTASGNLVSGGALGTPSSGTLTNCTGLPTAGMLDAAV